MANKPFQRVEKHAEDLHALSFTEGHANYYAFAEGMVFAIWLLRNYNSTHRSIEELYSIYTKGNNR